MQLERLKEAGRTSASTLAGPIHEAPPVWRGHVMATSQDISTHLTDPVSAVRDTFGVSGHIVVHPAHQFIAVSDCGRVFTWRVSTRNRKGQRADQGVDPNPHARWAQVCSCHWSAQCCSRSSPRRRMLPSAASRRAKTRPSPRRRPCQQQLPQPRMGHSDRQHARHDPSRSIAQRRKKPAFQTDHSSSSDHPCHARRRVQERSDRSPVWSEYRSHRRNRSR